MQFVVHSRRSTLIYLLGIFDAISTMYITITLVHHICFNMRNAAAQITWNWCRYICTDYINDNNDSEMAVIFDVQHGKHYIISSGISWFDDITKFSRIECDLFWIGCACV